MPGPQFRETHYDLLSSLLKKANDLLQCCGHLVLHGPPSVGKSFVLQRVVQSIREERVAIVKCNTFTSLRRAIAAAAVQVALAPTSLLGPVSPDRLLKLFESFSGVSLVVLENVDVVPDADEPLFSCLLSLNDILGEHRVCVVITTRVPPTDLCLGCLAVRNCLPIYFDAYSRRQLQILALELAFDFEKGTPEAALANGLSEITVPGALHRSLDLLVHTNLLRAVWSKFVSPRTGGLPELGAVRAGLLGGELCRLVRGVLLGVDVKADSGGADSVAGSGGDAEVSAMDIPPLSRIVLVAAFLASHIRERHDRELFVLHTRRKDRKRLTIGSKRRHFGEPHAVPLERLVAIVGALEGQTAGEWTEGVGRMPMEQSALLYEKIQSLLSMNLLTRLGVGTSLSGVRVRSDMTYDFVSGLARSLPLSLAPYQNYFT